MMKIDGISNSFGLGNIAGVTQAQPKSGESFASMLKQSLNEVNHTQVEGYEAMSGIATGRVKNLQEAVQKIEEAELSLKLALEVKNKAINAYREVMKMQI
ncbi:flagellar hook-basal body complex protein FliE [Arcobacter sp. FWKO B]|uniref:flagellar hook-basal body complex protein FliE n=1 Tax=Arcobacter sp. FWKO B TaxID=2593672 RepID=UPI0018A3B9BD|nr:flagellar hook-basal body complex protein FliE [Arcobacter sp. FWKO B]QOG12006.1 flagellar hook-basal body complex protein FliE [Arcobacter sp. FWKO B]